MASIVSNSMCRILYCYHDSKICLLKWLYLRFPVRAKLFLNYGRAVYAQFPGEKAI